MTSRPTTRFAAAVAGLALLAAACSGGSDTAEPAPVEEATQTPISAAPTAEAPADSTVTAADASADDAADAPVDDTVVVPAALQFSAPLVGGGDIDATTLAGKPTAFWFWAPT